MISKRCRKRHEAVLEHDENEMKYTKMCGMQLKVKEKIILKSIREEKCLKSVTSASILRSQKKSKINKRKQKKGNTDDQRRNQ